MARAALVVMGIICAGCPRGSIRESTTAKVVTEEEYNALVAAARGDVAPKVKGEVPVGPAAASSLRRHAAADANAERISEEAYEALVAQARRASATPAAGLHSGEHLAGSSSQTSASPVPPAPTVTEADMAPTDTPNAANSYAPEQPQAADSRERAAPSTLAEVMARCSRAKGTQEAPLNCFTANDPKVGPFMGIEVPTSAAARTYLPVLVPLLAAPFCDANIAPSAFVALMVQSRWVRRYFCSSRRWESRWWDPKEPTPDV